jgi:starvation-inducible DNA-binding protein
VMVKELCDDNKELSKMINICLREVQKEGDEATADMLIGRMQVHDKNAWMLKSSL